MAQTKRKRQTKHRGNAAGVVTTRGRTGRPPSPEDRKKQSKQEQRERRLSKRPTWRSMAQRSMIVGVLVFVFLMLQTKGKVLFALPVAVLLTLVYIPLGYYFELALWRRRMAKQGRPTS